MLKYSNLKIGYVTFSSIIDLINSFGVYPDEEELYNLRNKLKRSKVVDIWHYDDLDAAVRCIDVAQVIRAVVKEDALRFKMYSSYAFTAGYFNALMMLGDEYPSAFLKATLEIDNNFGVYFPSSLNNLYSAYYGYAKEVDARVTAVEKAARGKSIGSRGALNNFRKKIFELSKIFIHK